VSFLVL